MSVILDFWFMLATVKSLLFIIVSTTSVNLQYWALKEPTGIKDDTTTYCPDDFDMFPCTCSGGYGKTYISCYGIVDAHVLDRVLSLSYPFSNMTELWVVKSDLGHLNSTFLYDNTFESIDLSKSGITSIGEGAFDHCQNTLRQLSLTFNPLGTFPFEHLQKFSLLENLLLGSSQLSDISSLVGLPPMFNLRNLNLAFNKLSHLPENVFFSVPHLDFLDLSYNSLTSLPAGVFLPLSKLQMLYLNNNDIHHLSWGTFWFSTPILRVVDFRYNELEEVEPDVFSGIDHGTQFDFSSNKLGEFPFEVFGPLVHTIADYHGGRVNIIGSANRPECNCGVAWFVTNQAYFDHVLVSRCANGTFFSKLHVEVLIEECINNSTDTHLV